MDLSWVGRHPRGGVAMPREPRLQESPKAVPPEELSFHWFPLFRRDLALPGFSARRITHLAPQGVLQKATSAARPFCKRIKRKAVA